MVRIFEPKIQQTRSGPTFNSSFVIKDDNGDQQVIDMWRKTNEMCVMIGKVYIFSNLVTKGFPEDKPHHLKLCNDNDAALASDDQQQKLAHLGYADGRFSGKILAIHSPITFKSCNHCRRSITKTILKVGEECFKCHKVIREVIDDYSITIVVENGTLDVLSMTCFRRHLPVEKQDTQNLLEDELCRKYEGKMVKGDYKKKRYPERNVEFTVETLNFSK